MGAASPNRPEATARSIRTSIQSLFWRETAPHVFKHGLPAPSQSRVDHSLNETALDLKHLDSTAKEKTVLYLAYGSNLCAETFQGKRGIRPVAQVNVVVPSLRLTFDLPGIPYLEPCFSNTALRDATQDGGNATTLSENTSLIGHASEYHKDRWKKGLVGVVYEVTLEDYIHIIATEGGGTAYKDVLVDCYPLDDAHVVPEHPAGQPFKAHTLFAPAQNGGRLKRPDPSYAQPSARYLKLITDGAEEHALPQDYREYMFNIRPYTMTTKRQRFGQIAFASVWMPFFLLMFALQKAFQDGNGNSPPWLAAYSACLLNGVWTSYDGVFRKLFGDGERTMERDDEEMQFRFCPRGQRRYKKSDEKSGARTKSRSPFPR